MSVNVSQVTNDFNKVVMENCDKAASTVAGNFSSAEDILMQAYTAKDDSTIKSLARKLGMDENSKIEQIQMVAQTKYEKASRIYSVFTKIMENAHQMLMQLINKIC